MNMKKIYMIVLLVSTMSFLNAQTITQKQAYKYETLTFLDMEYNPVDSNPVNGIIVFSEAAGYEFISVTIGDRVRYNGYVRNKKLGQMDGKEKTNVYLFTTEFQGYEIPVQLFEIYDISMSNAVPQRFMLSIHNMKTGVFVQGLVFENISRVK